MAPLTKLSATLPLIGSSLPGRQPNTLPFPAGKVSPIYWTNTAA